MTARLRRYRSDRRMLREQSISLAKRGSLVAVNNARSFLEELNESVLVGDGAIGTALFARGVIPGARRSKG